MRKISLGLAVLLLLSIFLSACQLLPEEEALPSMPVIQSHEVKEYKYVTVTRGDLVSSATVRVEYKVTKQETLSFQVSSLLIDTLTVTGGQSVKKGDVLATLDLKSIQPQLDAQNYQLNLLYKEKEHLKQTLDLELKHYDKMLASLKQELQKLQESNPSQEDSAVLQQIKTLQQQIDFVAQRRTSAQNTYDSNVETLDGSIYLKRLQLEELEASFDNRRLIAGMDGVITYLRTVKTGQRSTKGERFITISDFDSAAFTAKTEYAQDFTVGSVVTVKCQGKAYETIVVTAEDLGLETTDDQTENMVYLKLKEPDPSLTERTNGTVELTFDSRSNVLCVLYKAIQTLDGNTFVYVLDENDLRTMRNVTVGLKAGNLIEIVSGLNEGDRVIVD